MRNSVANTLTRKYPNKFAIPFAKSKKTLTLASPKIGFISEKSK